MSVALSMQRMPRDVFCWRWAECTGSCGVVNTNFVMQHVFLR